MSKTFDEIEDLKKEVVKQAFEIGALNYEVSKYRDCCGNKIEIIQSLESKLSEALKDSKRLDLMIKNECQIIKYGSGYKITGMMDIIFNSPREAIDYCMLNIPKK